MPERTSLILSTKLEGFTAKIVVPLNLTFHEAQRIKRQIDACIVDPAETAKVTACDPDFFPEPAA